MNHDAGPAAAAWPGTATPTTLAQIVAELAVHGALVVWTRAAADLAVRTVVHLDGDVTTTITPACLTDPRRDELLRRHEDDLQKLGVLLRHGAAHGAGGLTLVAATALAVATAAADIIAGHSWVHAVGLFGGVGGACMLATRLLCHINVWLLVRSARRQVNRLWLAASTA